MRRLRELNAYRDATGERMTGRVGGGDDAGCFRLMGDHGTELTVIASSGEGWDHVLISTRLRCPTWAEMEQVKRLFFLPTETAMQLHVPPTAHISVHPHCLHLWRPHDAAIPMPPSWMVA